MLERYSAWLRNQCKTVVEQKQLVAGYVQVFPEFRADGNLRVRVKEALDELAQSGVVRLPVGKGGWDVYGAPRLPLWVSVVREKVVKPDYSGVNWLPELSFATKVLRGAQLEKLKVLNQFLIENRRSLMVVVPYRERALEIFGDEKAFDGAVKGDMLYGKIPLSVICACNPEPPLAREDFDGAHGPLLVLENHHTFWSMLQWNRVALRYRSIGYGSGNTILKSARAILDAIERSGATYAEYFGDLDPAGVNIAATLSKSLQAAGGTGLKPATTFYQWMLRNGLRKQLGEDKRALVETSIDWFEPPLGEDVRLLFADQKWIAQESLSLKVLHTQDFAYCQDLDPFSQL
ncbi:hypothetical protein [Paraburkholderia pallida]|uniref:Wadjet protein JetD C-terminal domain-containing protein n=1 Tax=Paraburkholderia pallida TaxID=2547399 RepID=A0A4P7D780_9BURK|nr:hypothetical protein [Paraburkholderia pallida]QBR02472.1 hypothetical protein E1956_35070 [Paraburkholderia pallida]